jgi:starch-binding outer membrane protein, SusD/RagB family
VMPAATAAKGGTWNDQWELYPVPLTDLESDQNLVQNPGYQQ